jgi:hypothetical protein
LSLLLKYPPTDWPTSLSQIQILSNDRHPAGRLLIIGGMMEVFFDWIPKISQILLPHGVKTPGDSHCLLDLQAGALKVDEAKKYIRSFAFVSLFCLLFYFVTCFFFFFIAYKRYTWVGYLSRLYIFSSGEIQYVDKILLLEKLMTTDGR